MSGIKETREVVAAGRSYCTAIVKSCDDGKLNLFDARHMLAPVKATLEAVRGADQVISELRDVDVAEIDVLIEDFAGLAIDANSAVDALKKLRV